MCGKCVSLWAAHISSALCCCVFISMKENNLKSILTEVNFGAGRKRRRKWLLHFYGCREDKVCRSPVGVFFLSFFLLFEHLIFPFFSQRATSRESERVCGIRGMPIWFERASECVFAVRSTTIALQPCCFMRIHMIHYYPWHAPLCASEREERVIEMKRQRGREGDKEKETIRGRDRNTPLLKKRNR